MARRCALALIITAIAPLALSAPNDGKVSSERPLGDVMHRPPAQKEQIYGLCSGPQNADAFPSDPVPVTAGKCTNYQRYTATSAKPSTGGSCGGFSVAFGPKGDLKQNLDHIHLVADWGDTPLTEAQCAKAKVAAVGWGARCLNDFCTEFDWEKIGKPQQRAGNWNSTSKVCYIGVSFVSVDKKYITLNLDIITTLEEGGKAVRKRAKGTITASHPNGKCFSATQKPS